MDKIQVTRTSNNLPALNTPDGLYAIRMDEVNHPRYCNLPDGIRHEWLSGEILTMNMLKHQRPDEQMLDLDTVALDQFIMDEPFMRDLTQAEIDYAFRKGMRGSYGEYYGLTAESLFGFLEAFLDSPEKKESARLVRVARGLEKPKSKGAVDYLRAVDANRARGWAERMKEWQKEGE